MRTVTPRPRILERRKNTRCICRLPVAFHLEGAGQEGTALAMNIGVGGIRIDFPIEVTVGSQVRLTFLPNAERPSPAPEEDLDLRAQVVWTVASRSEGPYPTGLEFTNLDTPTQEKLEQLLHSLRG